MKKTILLIALTAILLSSFAFAATITVSPASSSTVSQNQVFNATVSHASPIGYNCSFYMYSSSTANSSVGTGVLSLNVANTSALSTWATVNTTIIQDSNDYTLYVNCTNGTLISATNTELVVQNTVPTAPSSVTPASNTLVTATGAQTFSGTVVDATTTGCTYAIARGGASSGNDYISGTATYSASTCSFSKTFSSSNDNGVWYMTLTATDGTDTAATQTTMNVQIAGQGGFNPNDLSGESPAQTGKNMTLWIIVGVAVIAYFLLRKKK